LNFGKGKRGRGGNKKFDQEMAGEITPEPTGKRTNQKKNQKMAQNTGRWVKK